MASQFKTVGIYGRVRSPGVIETLKALIDYLGSIDQDILVDTKTADALDDKAIPRIKRDDISEKCDLLIAVGGDGSLLHAAHSIIHSEIPVLGINRGRLGFLTDILPTQLHKIKEILDGKYHLEKRFMLRASVEHQHKTLGQHNALNEVALIPDAAPHMNEFEIYIDDQFVCSQDSDGVIVATPTGSTAYALSGGGPILHPQLDAMVIVPMFPHTLTMRPIVVEANQRITIKISEQNVTTPRLTCDSQAFIDAPPGCRIHIEKRPERLHLIHPTNYDYYETLRGKLHWGRKLHQSE